MRSHQETRVARLRDALSGILRGRDVLDWVEKQVLDLLDTSGQLAPPVEFTTKGLLAARKISSIRVNATLRFHGRLVVGRNGFELELGPTWAASRRWSRFAVAHELAHTLFYAIEDWPPTRLAPFGPRDPDFEWLCGRIAKCLLIPSSWIMKNTDNLTSGGLGEPSLEELLRLAELFVAPPRLVAERLIQHLAIWHCVLLAFTRYTEGDKAQSSDREPIWRLKWFTKPAEGVEGLFIPSGRKGEGGQMVYPRVTKRALQDTLETWIRPTCQEKLLEDEVPASLFDIRTLGSLGKFLLRRCGEEPVRVSVMREDVSMNDILVGKPNSKPRADIMLCIPLGAG